MPFVACDCRAPPATWQARLASVRVLRIEKGIGHGGWIEESRAIGSSPPHAGSVARWYIHEIEITRACKLSIYKNGL